MASQTVRFTTGPRVGNGKNNKRKVHKVGTKWIRTQKLPTVRDKVVRKLKTEERTRYDESKEGEEEEGRKRRERECPPLDAVAPQSWRESACQIQLPDVQDGEVAVSGSPRTSLGGR